MASVVPVLATPFDMWRRLKPRLPLRQLDRVGHVSVIGTTGGGTDCPESPQRMHLQNDRRPAYIRR